MLIITKPLPLIKFLKIIYLFKRITTSVLSHFISFKSTQICSMIQSVYSSIDSKFLLLLPMLISNNKTKIYNDNILTWKVFRFILSMSGETMVVVSSSKVASRGWSHPEPTSQWESRNTRTSPFEAWTPEIRDL